MKDLGLLVMVLSLVSCGVKKQDVMPQATTTTNQASQNPCPSNYDPILLTSNNGTLIKDLNTLPLGNYDYAGSEIFVFMQTSLGIMRTHYKETVSGSSASTRQICGDDSIPGNNVNITSEIVASYLLSNGGKTLTGKRLTVHVSQGLTQLQAISSAYPANTDLTAILQKSSASTVYQLSPTRFEIRSYTRATDASKTAHIETLSELNFTPGN